MLGVLPSSSIQQSGNEVDRISASPFVVLPSLLCCRRHGRRCLISQKDYSLFRKYRILRAPDGDSVLLVPFCYNEIDGKLRAY